MRKYGVYVIDVHEDWHMARDGVPDEANTPAECFEKIIAWCRAENVMPKTIEVDANPDDDMGLL